MKKFARVMGPPLVLLEHIPTQNLSKLPRPLDLNEIDNVSRHLEGAQQNYTLL